MNAHDVRHLALCPVCKQLGDDRIMMKIMRPNAQYFHSDCAVAKLGMTEIFALPRKERGKIRICDVSTETMMKLVELYEKETP